jgi:hypothetical protein
MQINVQCERQGENWLVAAPELNNFTTITKRLDKAKELVESRAREIYGNELCDVVIKVNADMPGIICAIESAQQKMLEASRLQEQASAEIRHVVQRMRLQGLTMRDIAVLLGVTPQRVAQLVGHEAAA